MDSFLTGATPSVAADMNTKLLNMMEDEQERLARVRGFEGIISVNTNLVTLVGVKTTIE